MSNTFKNVQVIKGKVHLNSPFAAAILGIKKIDLKNCLTQGQKDPMDGRSKVWALQEILHCIGKNDSMVGNHLSTDMERADYEDSLAHTLEVWEEVTKGLTSTIPPMEIETTLKTFSKELEFTSETTFPIPNPIENESSEPPITYKTIGEDLESIRKGILRITGISSSYPQPEDFDTIVTHVEHTCFGYLDETKDECMKACQVQGACAEKRFTMFQSIASNLEQHEAKLMHHHTVTSNLDEIGRKRRAMSANLGDWTEIDSRLPTKSFNF